MYYVRLSDHVYHFQAFEVRHFLNPRAKSDMVSRCFKISLFVQFEQSIHGLTTISMSTSLSSSRQFEGQARSPDPSHFDLSLDILGRLVNEGNEALELPSP